MALSAEKLKAKLEAAKEWPLPGERGIHERLSLWRAFREGNRDRLAKEVEWKADRPYLLDPLAERIPETWADLLFGDDPKVTTETESDQELLDTLVEENDLPSALQEAEEVCASEGEVWWRVYKDATILEVPTIEWHSRLDVVPLWIGRKLGAVAFVSEVYREETPDGKQGDIIWRYVAIHEEGVMLNLLYKGDCDSLGAEKALTERVETEDLLAVWDHGLPSILAGRVVNKRAPRNGSRSVYHGIRDYLLALNENLTIGQENVRLTGKKRAVVTPDMLDENGNFPSDTDVWIRQHTDGDPDRPGEGLIQVEWEFDAGNLKLWIDHLEEQAVTRSRIAPQLIGKATENALTGPALRARLFDTVLATVGKGRFWDDELPQALQAAQMVDALDESKGGFGHPWSDPFERPSVERSDALPVDEADEVQRIAQEISIEILSRKTAIEQRHPDWSAEQVDEELDRIKEEIFASAPHTEPPFDEELEPVST